MIPSMGFFVNLFSYSQSHIEQRKMNEIEKEKQLHATLVVFHADWSVWTVECGRRRKKTTAFARICCRRHKDARTWTCLILMTTTAYEIATSINKIQSLTGPNGRHCFFRFSCYEEFVSPSNRLPSTLVAVLEPHWVQVVKYIKCYISHPEGFLSIIHICTWIV